MALLSVFNGLNWGPSSRWTALADGILPTRTRHSTTKTTTTNKQTSERTNQWTHKKRTKGKQTDKQTNQQANKQQTTAAAPTTSNGQISWTRVTYKPKTSDQQTTSTATNIRTAIPTANYHLKPATFINLQDCSKKTVALTRARAHRIANITRSWLWPQTLAGRPFRTTWYWAQLSQGPAKLWGETAVSQGEGSVHEAPPFGSCLQWLKVSKSPETHVFLRETTTLNALRRFLLAIQMLISSHKTTFKLIRDSLRMACWLKRRRNVRMPFFINGLQNVCTARSHCWRVPGRELAGLLV